MIISPGDKDLHLYSTFYWKCLQASKDIGIVSYTLTCICWRNASLLYLSRLKNTNQKSGKYFYCHAKLWASSLDALWVGSVGRGACQHVSDFDMLHPAETSYLFHLYVMTVKVNQSDHRLNTLKLYVNDLILFMHDWVSIIKCCNLYTTGISWKKLCEWLSFWFKIW